MKPRLTYVLSPSVEADSGSDERFNRDPLTTHGLIS